MPNPLFNLLGGSPMGGMPQMGGNNPMQMIQEFMKFKENFKGDPKQEIQKLLQSGQMTQEQLNQFQQMAQQMQGLFKK